MKMTSMWYAINHSDIENQPEHQHPETTPTGREQKDTRQWVWPTADTEKIWKAAPPL